MGYGVWCSGYMYCSGDLDIGGSINKKGIIGFTHTHPKDSTKEIHYVCLEGGEAGTYVRGSAQLKAGVAVIQLPEHFGLVTGGNGLSAQVTPRDNTAKGYLYVESVTPEQLVVRESGDGTSNAKFDYFVQGIRLGYENHQVVQERSKKGWPEHESE
jgi:hypothetical protein